MNYDPDSVKSIFYQRSKVVQEEFALIELMIEREGVMKRLNDAIKDVNDLRKYLNDEQILKTVRLFNMLREVTIRFIKTVENWQGSFTKFVRPELYSIDYLISKFLRDIDFINASKLKKIFNFQFYRGNILLLPYPSGITSKNIDPLRVNPELGLEIKKFANPDEDQLVSCYQVLINSLPEEIYSKRLVSLEKWLIEPWVPNIFIYSKVDKPLFTPELISSLIGGSVALSNSEDAAAPAKLIKSQPRNSVKSLIHAPNHKRVSAKSKPQPQMVKKVPSSIVENNLPDINSKGFSQVDTQSDKDSRAKDIKADNISGSSSTIGSYSYKKLEQHLPLTLEERRELRQLENYVKEMASLFSSKVIVSPSKNIDKFCGKKVFFAHGSKEISDDIEVKPSNNALSLSSKKEVIINHDSEKKTNNMDVGKRKSTENHIRETDDGNISLNENEVDKDDNGSGEDDGDASSSCSESLQESNDIQSVDDSTIASEQTSSLQEGIHGTTKENESKVTVGKSLLVSADNNTKPEKSSLPSLVPPIPSKSTDVDIASLMNIQPGDEQSSSTYSRKKKKRKHLGVTTAAMRALFLQQQEFEKLQEASKVKPLRLMCK